MKKAIQPQKMKYLNAIILLGVAVLIIAAIQPWNAWNNVNPDAHGWNLFSYFTVQSNIIAAAVYCIAAVAILKRQQLGNWFRLLRGAAVLYMVITGLVYTFLLQNNVDANASLAFDWKNFVLHQFGPLFIVFWWLLWPSAKPITPKQSLVWLIFPVLWLVYTFIRAGFVDWYPYPFLNPDKVGSMGGVALYILGIAIGFILIGQLVAFLSRVRADNRSLY